MDEADGLKERAVWENSLNFSARICCPQLLENPQRDLSHLEAVGHPGAVKIPVVGCQDLGLSLEPPKGGGMDDAGIVDFVGRTVIVRILRRGEASFNPAVGKVAFALVDASFGSGAMGIYGKARS